MARKFRRIVGRGARRHCGQRFSQTALLTAPSRSRPLRLPPKGQTMRRGDHSHERLRIRNAERRSSSSGTIAILRYSRATCVTMDESFSQALLRAWHATLREQIKFTSIKLTDRRIFVRIRRAGLRPRVRNAKCWEKKGETRESA